MNRSKRGVVAAVMLLLGPVATGTAQDAHIMLAPDAVTWRPLPKEWIVGTLPPGVTITGQVAIIHGDPNKAGDPFIIRIKSPGNSVLPVHWHEFDENVTVLSGVTTSSKSTVSARFARTWRSKPTLTRRELTQAVS